MTSTSTQSAQSAAVLTACGGAGSPASSSYPPVPVGAGTATLRGYVAELCQARNLTRKAVAEAAGVSRSYMFTALNDPGNYRHVVARLAEFGGVPVEDLNELAGERVTAASKTSLQKLMADVAQSRGQSVERLIRDSGLNRGVVFAIASGRSSGTAGTLRTLAGVLGIDVGVLYEQVGRGVPGHPLSAVRAAAGLSRMQFAERAGLTIAQVRQAEQGESVSSAVALRITDALSGLAGDGLEQELVESAADAVRGQRVAACATDTGFGQLLDEYCARAGTTVGGFAAQAGMSRQYVACLVSGSISVPSPDMLARLASVLEVDSAELAGLIAQAEPPFAEEGARMRQLRVRSGMTQLELAAALGVREPSVSLWESGRQRASASTRAALAGLLGC